MTRPGAEYRQGEVRYADASALRADMEPYLERRVVRLSGSSFPEPLEDVSMTVRLPDGATVAVRGRVISLRGREALLEVDPWTEDGWAAIVRAAATPPATPSAAPPPDPLSNLWPCSWRDKEADAVSGASSDLGRAATVPVEEEHPAARGGAPAFGLERDGLAPLLERAADAMLPPERDRLRGGWPSSFEEPGSWHEASRAGGGNARRGVTTTETRPLRAVRQQQPITERRAISEGRRPAAQPESRMGGGASEPATPEPATPERPHRADRPRSKASLTFRGNAASAPLDARALRHMCEQLERADWFDVLGAKWIDSPLRLRAAYAERIAQYGPGSATHAASPMFAARIVELVEMAWSALHDHASRQGYRRHDLGIDERAAARFCADDARLALRRGEVEKARELLDAALDLHPAGEYAEARAALDGHDPQEEAPACRSASGDG